MPLFDYRCTACRATFEVARPLGKAGDESCPECGAPAKRVFTPVGVHFKGSGFHNTDYRSHGPSSDQTPAEKTPEKAGSCPAASNDGPSPCESCPANN